MGGRGGCCLPSFFSYIQMQPNLAYLLCFFFFLSYFQPVGKMSQKRYGTTDTGGATGRKTRGTPFSCPPVSHTWLPLTELAGSHFNKDMEMLFQSLDSFYHAQIGQVQSCQNNGVAPWWFSRLRIHLSATQETQEMWVQSLGQEDSLSRKWQSTAVFLPGKFHGGAWWATVQRVIKSQTWLSD